MPRLFVLALFAALLLGLVAPSLHSQALPPPTDQMGMQPYQSYHGGDIDQISLSSGLLNINVPVLVYPQRGKLHLSFNLLFGGGRGPRPTWLCIQLPPPAHQSCSWVWPTGKTVGSSAINVEFIQPPQLIGINVTNVINTTPSPTYLHYGNWSLVMQDGSKHPLGNLGTLTELPCSLPDCWYQASGPFETLDATGWRANGTFAATGNGANASGPNDPTPISIVGPDGVIYRSSKALEEDPNGNMITLNSGVVTDSLGRQISLPPTSSSSSNVSTSGCPQPPQVPLPVDHAVAWSVPGLNGGTATYTFCYAVVSINVPSGVFGNNSPAYTSTDMDLQSILLPNGQAWNFQYNDPGDGSTYNGSPVNYGTLTQIGLPTGGTISYTYALNGSNVFCQDNGRWITSRTVNANDGTGSHTWTYAYTLQNGMSASTTVTDPLGNYTVHTFGLITGCSGYETQAEYFKNGGTLLKTANTSFTSSSSRNVFSGTVNIVPVQTTTVWPNGKTSQITKAYDSYTYTDYLGQTGQTASYGKVLSESAYDYGTNAAGPLLRTTKVNYLALSNSSYLTNNLLNLLSSVQVLDSGGVQRAYTTYGYDEYTLNSSGVTTQHDSAPPTGSARGNQTSVHRWLNGSTVSTANCGISVSNSYLISYATFNDTGTVNTSVDSCGSSATDSTHMTTFAYSSNYVGAFPTSITNPKGQITSHTYDLNTGLLMSTTDPNNQTTNFTYDSLWRLASAGYPDGGLSTITRQETTFPFSATLTKKMTSSQNYIATNVFDGLGRVSQNQLSSDPQGTDYTVTTYDADGREASETNPYRSTSDATYGATSYQYDGLSRTLLVTKPDGSTVSTSYTGNCTTVTDEAGKNRQSCTDGLGRLTQITENPGGLGYVTNYQYDALNNLTSVLQNSSRQRTFVYDSLSRLTSSTNPETGTITYAYDADGNVITKTDARGITTTNSYDMLNRITQKSYSDGTTSALFTYDVPSQWGLTISNPVGRLTEAWNGTPCCAIGGAEIFSYDQVGRVIANWQCTPANCGKSAFQVTYTYDLAGDTATATNGEGVTISYQYNSAQRATAVTSSFVDATHPATLASAIQYAPDGAMSQITYGNGLTESSVYNSRLQPCRSNVNSSGTVFTSLSACGSTSMPTGNVLDLQYSWNAGSADNGNLVGTTVAGAQTYSRTYTYDQLNRLSSMSGTGGLCTGLNWGYDAWGNRTSQTQVSGTCFQQPTTTITASNQLSGYGYDAAGNMTSQPGATYTYDAESQLISASGGSASYVYDASGRRVQKTVSGAWLDYVYDLQGNVVAEVVASCGQSSPCWSTGYVYLNGRMLAEYENSTTYFVTGDHLGSSRLLTGVTGSVQDCNGFYPYGEQDAGICASSNTTTHKFTGKERDSESGLDDFGARYYSSSLGRFISADWSSVPAPVPYANLTNPQTLNLYAMVRDNPETFADLDGHEGEGSGDSGSSSSTESSGSDSASPSGSDQQPKANPQGSTSGASQNQTPQPSQESTQGQEGHDSNKDKTDNSDKNAPPADSGAGRGGKGGGKDKGERGRTSKPENPTKNAQPIRDKNGKIVGWRLPTPDGKGKVKTLEWGKANGLDPANFRTATKLGVLGAIGAGIAYLIATAPEWGPVAAVALAF